jgi:hypothetical protein
MKINFENLIKIPLANIIVFSLVVNILTTDAQAGSFCQSLIGGAVNGAAEIFKLFCDTETAYHSDLSDPVHYKRTSFQGVVRRSAAESAALENSGISKAVLKEAAFNNAIKKGDSLTKALLTLSKESAHSASGELAQFLKMTPAKQAALLVARRALVAALGTAVSYVSLFTYSDGIEANELSNAPKTCNLSVLTDSLRATQEIDHLALGNDAQFCNKNPRNASCRHIKELKKCLPTSTNELCLRFNTLKKCLQDKSQQISKTAISDANRASSPKNQSEAKTDKYGATNKK